MNFRHEWKFEISKSDILVLRQRLRAVARPDPHGVNGIYRIRSLYFDNLSDKALREKLDGVNMREKFRIRIYNGCADRVSLEIKRKERGKTQKLSCPLTLAQCESLMAGKVPDIPKDAPAVLQKLCLLMRTRLLSPKVIVEYARIPYVCPQGNVRVTLDEDIGSSGRTDLFLEKSLPLRPVMPAGQHILEVKYDGYLPDYIYRAVQTDRLRQTAFSKYYLCRRYQL